MLLGGLSFSDEETEEEWMWGRGEVEGETGRRGARGGCSSGEIFMREE